MRKMDCLFCNLIQRKISADIIYEDELCLVCKDVNPQAPHHMLVIPKQHISTINDAQKEHASLLGHMVLQAQHIAESGHFKDSGYRLVFNVNAEGGQTVYHIHMHILGGRQMSWPPG
jgi:histidine triad (HIT) family protein